MLSEKILNIRRETLKSLFVIIEIYLNNSTLIPCARDPMALGSRSKQRKETKRRVDKSNQITEDKVPMPKRRARPPVILTANAEINFGT